MSYRDIAARTGHAATTVMCVWNHWTEEGCTHRRASTGPRNLTTARDDLHLVRMAMEYCYGFGAVCFKSSSLSFEGWTVARMPLHRLPLSRDHKRFRLQWACERCHWRAEWRNVVFSDESRFNMSYNDGRIYARRLAGVRNLRACILQRHRGPTPSVMVWVAIGYNIRSRLLRI